MSRSDHGAKGSVRHRVRGGRGTTAVLLGSILLGWAADVGAGTVTAVLGHHDIPAGSEAYQIEVRLAGAASLTDFVGIFQVGDGGPAVGGTAAPKITAVSYAPSVWTTAAGGFSVLSGGSEPKEIVETSLALNAAGEVVSAPGLLVTLTINAKGFPVGGVFALKMKGTVLGDSALYHGAAPVELDAAPGTLRIVEPPPAVVEAPELRIRQQPGRVMQLSFFGAAGRFYRIFWSASPTGPWAMVPGVFPGAGAVIEWTDDGSATGVAPAASAKRFYYVEAHSAPPPADPPAPRLAISRLPGGEAKLSFHGTSGVSYRIRWSATPAGPWAAVPTTQAGAGVLIEWVDDGSVTGVSPALAPRRFYQVEAFQGLTGAPTG